jgi:hypothetical protein
MTVALKSRIDRILAALLVAVSAPLLLFAGASFHIRYMNDDFCLASGARSLGVPNWTARMYAGWSGNVTTFLLGGLNASLGLPAQPYSFLLLLAVWWLAAFGALGAVLQGRGVASARLLAALLTSSFLLAVVATSPNIYQSVYWQAGRLVYLLPVQLSAVTLWLMVQGRIRGVTQALLIGLVQAAASATSVSYALIAFLGLLFLRFVLRKGRHAHALSAAAVGALIGLVVLVAAPGNAVRRSHFPPPHFSLALACTAGGASTGMIRPWLDAPLPLLAVLVLSAATGCFFDRGAAPRRRWLVAGPLAVAGASVLAYWPACYAASTRLPERALMVPNAFAIALLAATSWGLGRALCPQAGSGEARPTFVGIALVAALFAVAATDGVLRALEMRERMSAVATAWDLRDRHVRDKARIGKRHVLAPPLGQVFDLPDLSWDPRTGENLCTAGYYSIESITVRPARTPPRRQPAPPER